MAFVGLVTVLVLRGLNGWPAQSAGFSTSQPWTTQAVMGVGAGLIGSVFLAALLALGAGFAHRWLPPGAPTARATTLWRGAALGTVWAGLAAVVSAARPPHGSALGLPRERPLYRREPRRRPLQRCRMQ